jgi:hypothetical protein
MAPNILRVSPNWQWQYDFTPDDAEMTGSDSALAFDTQTMFREVKVGVAIGVDITCRCSCPLEGRLERGV